VLERLRALAADEGVQTVVLPRVQAQREELERMGSFVVPQRAIDAQSLIASSSLVISAGGTMNREAVALGVPVYTTFEGRPGAVDEALIAAGRMRKLGDAETLEVPARREEPSSPRVRRDPRALVELLLSPVRPCSGS
jgi:uncharacterized protein